MSMYICFNKTLNYLDIVLSCCLNIFPYLQNISNINLTQANSFPARKTYNYLVLSVFKYCQKCISLLKTITVTN